MIALVAALCLGQTPLVVEHYDEIAFVREADSLRGQVYFVRDGKVVASRGECDAMLWIERDGEMALAWCDYGVCERIVSADVVTFAVVTRGEPIRADQPWWWMGRAMTDLKQPE